MTGSSVLAAAHDVLLVDLDGTVRLAGQPVAHAAASLTAATDQGARTVIVTNNPSRSPQQLEQSLAAIGVRVAAADIVTSAQAAATMLAADHPAGARILVLGTAALCDALADAGLTPVRRATDEPVAVVQGHSPDTAWGDLAEACIAIRAGVDWVATNTDPTLPTDRGLLPGNGSMVQALVTATGRRPRVAGKPGRELLDAAAAMSGAQRPLVVGDRLDTDIAAAVAAGMASLFVLTGVNTAADLLAAPAGMRPTFVAADLRGLVDEAAVARIDEARADAGHKARWAVTTSADRLDLQVGDRHPSPRAGDAITALAALAAASWRSGVTRVGAADSRAAAVLSDLGLG